MIITQFDYPTCESLGLLKMDFLGLRNLTIMDDAVKMVKANKGIDLDLLALPLDDPKTYELLGRGDTLGVFQFDGGPMRSLLRLMKPDNFEDISAVSALYRPGPMGVNSHTNYALRKNGQQEITPIHPELEEPLEEVLGRTYGLIVYQEQVQKAAQILAGYSLGEADMLRRAMGKKKPDDLAKKFTIFQAGAKKNGYSDEAIQALWDVLVPFAGYAFNKAHSAAYGLVSYWTAYLKANYPAEYMAGAAHLGQGRQGQVGGLPQRVPAHGHQGAPAGRQRVGANFAAQGDDVIRFGLDGGPQRRHQRGRVDHPEPQGQGEVRLLPRLPRQGRGGRLQQAHHRVADQGGRLRLDGAHPQGPHRALRADDRQRGRGQAQGGRGPVRPLRRHGRARTSQRARLRPRRRVHRPSEWDKTYLLAQEREMLGLYVSDHPLFGLEHVLSDKADAAIAQLTGGEHADGAVVTIGGIISGLQRKMTKQGNAWAIATVEDLAGSIECMFFPATYQLVSTQLVEDAVVFVKGRLDKREDVPRLVAMELQVPDLSERGHQRARDPHHPGAQGHPADGQPPRRDPQPPQGRHRGPHQAPGPAQDHRAAPRPAPGEAGPGALRRPEGAARPVLPGGLSDRRGAMTAEGRTREPGAPLGVPGPQQPLTRRRQLWPKLFCRPLRAMSHGAAPALARCSACDLRRGLLRLLLRRARSCRAAARACGSCSWPW